MTTRYQVFVSSTFRDLVDERREVMHALLELDCFPAGMELFPAANSAAWELIERTIADSDYYVLIIGGKYGSVDTDGISFTEREFDFAVGRGIPLLAFLPDNPDDIPAGKSELNELARERLEVFRNKVASKYHCKFWRNAEDLGAKVSRGLVSLIKSDPRDGWVRASHQAETTTQQIRTTLEPGLAQIREMIRAVATRPLTPVVNISSPFTESAYDGDVVGAERTNVEINGKTLSVTYDQIFEAFVFALIEKSDEQFVQEFSASRLMHWHDPISRLPYPYSNWKHHDFCRVRDVFCDAGLLALVYRDEIKNMTGTDIDRDFLALTENGRRKARGILHKVIG